MEAEHSAEATHLLARLIAQGAFPGAVLLASTPQRTLEAHAGRLSVAADARPVVPATRYDLASVTKTFVSVATVVLLQRGRLALDDEAGRYLPDLPSDKRALTIRRLLAHTSGLKPGAAVIPRPTEPEAMRRRIVELPFDAEPGARVIYSSLGYLILGWILERVMGRPLDAVLGELVLTPLNLKRTGFRPPQAERSDIAATEQLPGGMVQGQVHDETSRILGGVTGHAGLFADAADVMRFGRELLDGDGDHLGLGAARPLLFHDLTGGLDPNRSAAFVIDDPVFTTFGATTFTHTGFTGTSICLVPERSLVVVLLTNRVNPTRDNDRIGGARTAVHGLVAGLL